MSNANFPGELNRGEWNGGERKPLRDALRALPQLAPERSAWPELAAQLSRKSQIANRKAMVAAGRARRWFVPATIAAALLVAFAVSQRLQRTQDHSAATTTAATVARAAASIDTNAAESANGTNPQIATEAGGERQLTALQQRSQELEHWLRETSHAGAPLAGQDLAAATEIEDMIGLVDGQLNASSHDSELSLWRRRVALLEDLTALRYSSYKLAETGVALR